MLLQWKVPKLCQRFLFIYLYIYSFIYLSYIYLFICKFIYLFIKSLFIYCNVNQGNFHHQITYSFLSSVWWEKNKDLLIYFCGLRMTKSDASQFANATRYVWNNSHGSNSEFYFTVHLVLARGSRHKMQWHTQGND